MIDVLILRNATETGLVVHVFFNLVFFNPRSIPAAILTIFTFEPPVLECFVIPVLGS